MQIYSLVSEKKMFEEIVNDDDYQDDDVVVDGCQVIAIVHMAYGQVS